MCNGLLKGNSSLLQVLMENAVRGWEGGGGWAVSHMQKTFVLMSITSSWMKHHFVAVHYPHNVKFAGTHFTLEWREAL